ncbi:MAG: hypothetical protein MOGMAGMI_00726 [Candidatus Omnitrophica bacterium]|nr:hypothetical protein [Candidatus Omnitrophota bacterium]
MAKTTTSKVQTPTKKPVTRLAADATKSAAARSLTPAEQRQIEQLAYSFYEQRGFQHGHDREDWLRAEAIVRSRRS